MAEQWGIPVTGHPWLKPVRFHPAWNDANPSPVLPGVTEFFNLDGEEVHEVGVGPVHAGIMSLAISDFHAMVRKSFHLEEMALGFNIAG